TQALRELFELTAGDSGRLVNECEKLASFVGAGGVVSAQQVRDICAENPRRTVFELVDIVAAGDLSEARCSLEKLLTAGESPTGLLFWLGSHYLNLYLLREGRELAPQMRWLANRLRGQAKSFSSEQLREAISQIADCEAFMKGGVSRRRAESPREALEDLVRDLCLQRTPAHLTTAR
ncbi:MAG TPA: hypothetical protein VLB27_10640, partial [candidate division Zixibacteria bacterium]|nr:hypothetical protein [candidate division Zixibacteria bacterium]